MNNDSALELRKSELLYRGVSFIKEVEEEGLTDHEITYMMLSLLAGCINVYCIEHEDIERIFNQIRQETSIYRNYWDQCG